MVKSFKIEELRRSSIKPLTTVQDMVAHASVASRKPKVELDSHADTCVVGDSYLVIHAIVDQLMSAVTFKKKATEVPRQLLLQYGIKIHRVDRSLF